MSYIEVDQSGKIEQFDKDTVVALSNDHNHSILIPKRLKQKVFTAYKGKVTDLKYKLFSIAIFYCLKNVIDEDTKTTICCEYERKDTIIKSFLLDLLREHKLPAPSNLIRFNSITKDSPAHELAINVFRGKEEPDLVLSEWQMTSMLR